MDLDISGLNVVLTGGTSGIGRASVEMFLEEGANVSFCARGKYGINRTLSELERFGDSVSGDPVDVADTRALQQWISDSADRRGGIDIFVSNVSAMGGPDKWKQVFDLDVMGTVRGVEAVLPHMREAGGGSIVLISSTAAVETFRGPTAYAAFKAGLLNYAKNLGREVAGEGIRVNSVMPGPVYFPGGAWDELRQTQPELFEAVIADLPTGRMATPQDVASAVMFLSSQSASYVTGTALVVDGGFLRRVQY